MGQDVISTVTAIASGMGGDLPPNAGGGLPSESDGQANRPSGSMPAPQPRGPASAAGNVAILALQILLGALGIAFGLGAFVAARRAGPR
jgi:hypothetical protein